MVLWRYGAMVPFCMAVECFKGLLLSGEGHLSIVEGLANTISQGRHVFGKALHSAQLPLCRQ